MQKALIITFFVLLHSTFFSQEKPYYPEPSPGFKRVDLILPKIENYTDFKVEIRFGMETNISECALNSSFSFNPNNLKEEYGISPSRFPYYVLSTNNITEITLGFSQSNCDKGKKVKKKILSSQNIFREYTGHYKVPFYIPEKWSLEYRIWKVDNEYISIK